MRPKPIHPLLRTAYRGVNRLHLRTYEQYQPVSIDGREYRGARDCDARWAVVNETLRRFDCRSMVDLGCSEGYYVLRSARSGLGFCVGVDFDLRRLWTCQNQVLLEEIPNAAFLMARITPAFIDTMPRFDAGIFFSVLHHIMAASGLQAARAILEGLSRRIDRVLVFEMGQHDETSETWAARLPDMGSDPHAWIADFVASCGFVTVTKMAEAASYGRTRQRAVFVCTPR